MDSSTTPTIEIVHDVSPYLVEYKGGAIKRLAGTQQIPPGVDPITGVASKDIILESETSISARLYRPPTNGKLPLVVYFHGGAFLIASPAEPLYHNFCNTLAASANALIISVDYRLAPEHPLPAAFHDAWAAVQCIVANESGHGPEVWLNSEGVDFGKMFLAGDSAGVTLAHYVACRFGLSGQVRICGLGLIHPYFWGKDPIGSEHIDPRKVVVDKWWEYVCPSDKGCDDPLINPFADGAPSLDDVACEKMLVLVAEKDVLRDRGVLYHDAMARRMKAELFETIGEDHVFYIFDPQCEKAKELVEKLASFINN